MRVLIVTNLYPPQVLGGYEILCAQVTTRLKSLGHDLVVLTSTHGDGPRHETVDGIEVHRRLALEVPFDRPATRDRQRRLLVGRENERITGELIASFKPELVFIWSQLRSTLGSALAAKKRGIPVLFTFNDQHPGGYVPVPFGASPRRALGWFLDRTLYRSTTLSAITPLRGTSISRSLRDDLSEAGVPTDDVRVIFQGIPLENFPVKSDAGALQSPLRVLYAGQLHPYKGVHTLVEAATLVAQRRGRGSLRLSVIGAGESEYTQRLRTMAAGLDADFPGRVPHGALASRYRSHDVFVFPSVWREPFGLTHLEAMASGTPVISTTEGGPGEFLVDGENALTFPKEDAEALSLAIERLMDDKTLARSLAKTARRDVEQRFSLDRYVSELDELMTQTVQGRTHEDRRDPAPLCTA